MKMKKITAVLAAAIMAFAMVSCGTSASDESAAGTTAPAETTTTKAAEETTTTAAAAEEKPEETEAETETTTTAAAEEVKEEVKEAEEEVKEAAEAAEDAGEKKETGFKDGVYTGAFFSFDVNDKKWKQGSQAGVEVMFQYIGESSDPMAATANFNIVAQESSMYKGVSAKDYAEQVEQAYSSMDNFKVISSGDAKLGGKDVYAIKVSYTMNNMNMVINQLIYCEDGKLMALSYGALDSVIDSVQPEFDEVINSFKFN